MARKPTKAKTPAKKRAALPPRPLTPEGFLGHVVTDKISGFKGIVVSIAYTLSGSVMGHAMPKADKDNKVPDGFYIDLDRFEVDGAVVMTPMPADDTSHIVLGTTAQDRVTGVEGTLTEKVVHINGCTSVAMVAKTEKKDERNIVVDWKRLDLANSRSVVPPPKSPVPNLPTRGGPMRRVAAGSQG